MRSNPRSKGDPDHLVLHNPQLDPVAIPITTAGGWRWHPLAWRGTLDISYNTIFL
jgi:hypothetical protein